jgi:serine/threonine protein kinase
LLKEVAHHLLSQFQTEIKIHKSMNNINIVKFARYFEDSEFAYIAMELCHNNVSIVAS